MPHIPDVVGGTLRVADRRGCYVSFCEGFSDTGPRAWRRHRMAGVRETFTQADIRRLVLAHVDRELHCVRNRMHRDWIRLVGDTTDMRPPMHDSVGQAN